ncbi:MAG: hypothetical protein Kow00121_65580 [Elainellaceae cyanobacterium]
MNTDAVLSKERLELHQIDSGNFASAVEGDAFLLKQGDRNFPHPAVLVKGDGLAEAIEEIGGSLYCDSLVQ